MRQEEEMCRETFDAYLARKLSPEERRWDKGDEPPDYYLKVGSTKYAVEVTTVRHHYVVGSEQLPILSVVLALSRLVQKVEEQASREGVLSGTYFVHLEAITNLGRFQDRISKGLLNFVRRTQADESASKTVIFEQDGERCAIEKRGNLQSRVYPCFKSTAWSADEIQWEACRLLQDIMADKAQKLSRVTLPKIVLLHNQIPIFERAHYERCLQALTALKEFHTIFVVDVIIEDKSYVLYSGGRDW